MFACNVEADAFNCASVAYVASNEELNDNNCDIDAVDDALKLFNYVFDKPYEHLDVCTVTNKYYKSFNPLELEY